jgi:hypothetical protein
LGSRWARGRHAPGKALFPRNRCGWCDGSRRRRRGDGAACGNARISKPVARLGCSGCRRRRACMAARAHGTHLDGGPAGSRKGGRIRAHGWPYRGPQV